MYIFPTHVTEPPCANNMAKIPMIVVTEPPNMAVPDDLAALFAKNLTLNSAAIPPAAQQDPEKIVYVSMHYNHSAHITNSQPQQQDVVEEPMQRRSSEPPRTDLHDLELLLRSHGVNTTALSLPQVELFRHADDAQKQRLIQLWTICPPTNSTDNPTLTWSNTTLEQEEMLAQRRYEAKQQPMPATEVVMSLDGTEMDSVSADPGLSNSPTSVQSNDGRWAPLTQTYMEPYMQSGYEELARREYEANARKAEEYKAAVDPVYKSTGGMLDWERQQWMENQYGSFVGGWRDDEEML